MNSASQLMFVNVAGMMQATNKACIGDYIGMVIVTTYKGGSYKLRIGDLSSGISPRMDI